MSRRNKKRSILRLLFITLGITIILFTGVKAIQIILSITESNTFRIRILSAFSPSDQIDFSDVLITQSKEKVLTITARGNTDLEITSIVSDRPEFTIDQTAFTIAPGNSRQIMISFKPTTEGTIIGTLTIKSNTGYDKTIDVSGFGKPKILLDKTEIYFGDVLISERSSKVVEVSNIGTTDLVITGIGASNGLFTVDRDTAQIIPGGTQPIDITFAPNSEGQATGTITIKSNGGNDKTIDVSGFGKPKILLDKTEIYFGDVLISERSSRVVEVSNIGTTDLVITGIGASNGLFTVDRDTAQIIPGGTQPIDITFAPNSEGQATGTITIKSNGGNDKTIDVTGNGVRVWSTTHPDQSLWYQNAKPVFTWASIQEAVAYYALLDQNPSTTSTVDNGYFLFRTEIDYPDTPDGVWYFHVSAEMEDGNLLFYHHRQIRIDTTPPMLSSSTHANQNLWSDQRSATLSWTIDHPESVTKYYYKLDQKSDTIPTDADTATTKTSVTLNNLPEGVNYFHIVAEDLAGYVGKKASHYRILHENLEVSSPSHPQSGMWYQDSSPVFNWTTFPTATGYYVVLDRNPQTLPTAQNAQRITDTTVSFPDTNDGEWFVHVRPDLAVGEPVVEHFPIRINTKLSAIRSSTHPDQAQWYSRTSATLSWTIDHPESVTKYYYKLDQKSDTIPTDADTATTKTTVTFNNLPEGINYFHTVSEDLGGNVSQQASHYRILRGSFSANSSSHPNRELWYQDSDAVFSWTSFPTASGYYTLMDAKPNTVPDETNAERITAKTISYSDTDDGEWFFHVCPDLAVGKPVVEHVKIRIDTKPPVVTSSTHPNQNLWSDQRSVTLSWRVDHPESVREYYYYKLNQKLDTIKSTTETSLTIDDIPLGVNNFRIYKIDLAGNISPPGLYRLLHGNLEVISPSHPKSGVWYQNQEAVFNWTEFPTATGYYVGLDKNPQTLPTAQNAQRITDTTVSFSDTNDGEWFFHVRPELEIGEPVVEHLPIRIDNKFTPTVSSTTHHDAWLDLPTVRLSWKVEHLSSVEKFYYKVDQNPNTQSLPTTTTLATSTTKTNLRLSNHPDGEYYFHVVAQDEMGELGSDVGHYRFRIDTTPPQPVTVLESRSECDNERDACSTILEWEAADDAHSGVANYEVFRSSRPDIVGRRIAEPVTLHFTDQDSANDGNEYFYTVNPIDHAGNVQRIGNIRISTETGPIQPDLSVDRTLVDFGGVETGTSKTEELLISNDGNGILDILEIKTTNSNFEITQTVESIPPSRSEPLEIKFTPLSMDMVTATMIIIVKNSNFPEQRLELRGYGTQAEIELSRNSVDFGMVEVYNSKTQTVELLSVGTAALIISSIEVEQTEPSASPRMTELKIDAPFVSEEIQSGESRSLVITFSPTSAEPISTTLTIISNDLNSPKSISISGTVSKPIIAFEPEQLDFGGVQVYTTETKTLTLRNDGDADLQISSASLTRNAEFEFVDFADGDSLVVGSGSSQTLSIQFTPSDIAEFTGELTLASNDPNTPEKVITLTGSGGLPPQVVSEVSIAADASQVPANGVSVGTFTITAKKSSGQPAIDQPVTISVSGSENTVEPIENVTDENGIATAKISSTKIESKTITATVGEEFITKLSSTTVEFIEPVNDFSISAERERIRADGKSQLMISISVDYPKENSEREPKPTLTFSPNLGELGTIEDNDDGTYAATYTAPDELNQTRSVSVTAQIGDKNDQIVLTIVHAEIIQSIAPESIKIGELTTLNGEIFPAIETEINLSFKRENKEINEPVTTDSQGKYQYKFTGTRAGDWSVTAKWDERGMTSEVSEFTVEKGKTELTLSPPENLFSLTPGDFVQVSGELVPSLGQVELTVSLKNPDGEENTAPLQTDDEGKYQHEFRADIAGVWRIQVHFAGDADYAESQSTPLDLPIGTELGRAIIVAGGPEREENNTLWNTTRKLCNSFFQILRERGYSRDMIHYLSPAPFEDVDGDGQNDRDGSSTVDELRKAITELPLEFFKKNPSAQLVIYYTGHSFVDKLQLGNEQEVATAQNIDQWLDLLQTEIMSFLRQAQDRLLSEAEDLKIVVIIDGSRSGSFVEKLADNNRTIITSTDAAKTMYFGAEGNTSFTKFFSQFIALGHSISESFRLTEENFIGQEPPFDFLPKLESDGDGVPNQETDLQIASELFIGSDITPGTTVPVLDQLSEPQTIEDTSTAEFWAKITTIQGINEVWAVITPPDYKPPADGISELPTVFLLPSTDGKRYEGSYDNFEKVGDYIITFFAEDLRYRISAPKQITVTVKPSKSIDPDDNLMTTWGKIKTALLPIYPNPSNPETWIPYQLANDAIIVMTIYDVGGKKVRRICLGHKSAGSYRSKEKAARWDGRDDRGECVASGIYFVKMIAGEFEQTRRLTVLK